MLAGSLVFLVFLGFLVLLVMAMIVGIAKQATISTAATAYSQCIESASAYLEATPADAAIALNCSPRQHIAIITISTRNTPITMERFAAEFGMISVSFNPINLNIDNNLSIFDMQIL